MSKKIIAVTGATGAQGGGLVRAILADKSGEFGVRAISRKPGGDKAQELVRLGVQVVAGDLDNRASLAKAFEGAYGAFCVTNYWEHFSPERETEQGRNLAAAARDAGVKHAVWSTFEDTRATFPVGDTRMPTLKGQYKVPHFDAKAEADARFRELGVPTTFLLTSFYWDNLIGLGMGPRRGPDGKLTFMLPMGNHKLPGIAAEDIGKCVFGVFKRPDLVGKVVGVAGEHLTGEEMAVALERALEQPVGFTDLSPAAYRDLGFPGADDIGNMFQFKAETERAYCGIRDVVVSRSLNPELQTFAKWLSRNKSRIPLE